MSLLEIPLSNMMFPTRRKNGMEIIGEEIREFAIGLTRFDKGILLKTAPKTAHKPKDTAIGNPIIRKNTNKTIKNKVKTALIFYPLSL
jgi:hypothetical protein